MMRDELGFRTEIMLIPEPGDDHVLVEGSLRGKKV